jgi:hypothetical protein
MHVIAPFASAGKRLRFGADSYWIFSCTTTP